MAFKMSSFAETMALGYLKSQVVNMELICVMELDFYPKMKETMALGYLKSQVMKMKFSCVDGIRFLFKDERNDQTQIIGGDNGIDLVGQWN